MPIKYTVKLTTRLINIAYRVVMVLVLAAIALGVYESLIRSILDGRDVLLPFILLWVLTSYIVLPRFHRWLTSVYLPNYFVGRARTSDGLLGDPVNLALIGSESQLHAAFEDAGWERADELSIKSSIRMAVSTILRRSYPNAPVSSLYLFGRKHSFAYQQEVDGNPHARHHIRFWYTPKNWWLPGGHKADWVAAATYDKSVGFSGFTWQITHKIESKTDIERDYVIDTLKKTKRIKKVEVRKHFTTAFRDRNGGGDQIETDGSLPFVQL